MTYQQPRPRRQDDDGYDASRAYNYRGQADELDARELLQPEMARERAHLDGPADDWSEQ